MSVHVFGIRHHGPGCARSLLAALEALRPDAILVEGPPDAEDVLPLVLAEGMQPPVSLLIYPAQSPSRAVFYPFAEFSPEWQAIRYGLKRKLPVRFMDLPQCHRMAMEEPENTEGLLVGEIPSTPPMDTEPAEPAAEETAEPAESPEDAQLRDDPLGMLALAAGYNDRELWWEHQIEQRQDPSGLFEGIMEAMTALRATAVSPRRYESEREAHMRTTIRAAVKEGFERIAVVCGAWHAPALDISGPAAADKQTLKSLPKTSVVATWIPWTYSRLAYRSGYGAGVTSPGWYHHLWTSRRQAAVTWAALAARLLREEDLDASSASVIETVRLADALAAMRDLPMPGLTELNEAVQTVLCFGDPAPMRLIRQRLEIGDRLGAVPAEAPTVPLQRDLEAQQKRLRLKPATEIKVLDLDLRKENDLARSHLLHRLRLLDIPWGDPQHVSGKSGTFHEIWQLQWQVEFAVSLVEASVWGSTVDGASAASVRNRADQLEHLPGLTALLDGAILADLSGAVEHVLIRLQNQAAVAADVRHLMDALPPLARVARYGDVRKTRTDQVLPVIDGLFERILVGLPAACASLDDEAAANMVDSIGSVQHSLSLLDDEPKREPWQAVLRTLLDSDTTHGLVRGWACRLLLEQRVLPEEELHRRARLALSPAVPAVQAAAWLEGLLRGSGLVLLHEDGLWTALDQWLSDLNPELFIEMLPLVRRAFSGFKPPERRAMAEKVKQLGKAAPRHAAVAEVSTASINRHRADRVIPILVHSLGDGSN